MNASTFVHRQPKKANWYWGISQTRRESSGSTRPIKNHSTTYLRSLVKRKMQQGQTLGAISILTSIIKRHPESAADYNNRGLLYFQMGKLEKAIADYNQALELDAKLDSAYNNRANFYATQKMWSEALSDYDMALNLNPINVRAWINQGITFRQLGMYEQALDNFEMALHFDQLKGMSYAQRGRSYHLRGDWNCALADYRRATNHLTGLSKPENQLMEKIELWQNELLSFSLRSA
jgi:tetratricopeptide (TPR) repeat protein